MKANKTDIDLLQKIRNLVLKKAYIVAKHAIERQKERQVDLPEVLHALVNGRHEREKDFFDIKRQAWKYAIRGRTIDGVDLRVIVVIEDKLLLITVIRMG